MKKVNRNLLFAIFLVLYELSTYIANDMILPGMLCVIKELHAHAAYIPLSFSIYLLGNITILLFIGPLADKVGRRTVMLAGVTFFCICTLGISFTHNIQQFMFLRFLEGMGLAVIDIAGYASIQEIFEEKKAIRITSILSNITLLAPLIGPLAGATWISLFSWRSEFLFIFILSILALYGLWLYMPETIDKKFSVSNNKFSPHWIKDYRSILQNSTFLTGCIALGCSSGILLSWIAISPTILLFYGKFSFLQYALIQTIIFSFTLIGNFILYKWTAHYAKEKIIARGSILLFSAILMEIILIHYTSFIYLTFILTFTLYACGIGIIRAPLYRLVLFSTPIMKSTASAMISFISMFIYIFNIEITRKIYLHPQHSHYALFCLSVIFIYGLILYSWKLYSGKTQN